MKAGNQNVFAACALIQTVPWSHHWTCYTGLLPVAS